MEIQPKVNDTKKKQKKRNSLIDDEKSNWNPLVFPNYKADVEYNNNNNNNNNNSSNNNTIHVNQEDQGVNVFSNDTVSFDTGRKRGKAKTKGKIQENV